MHTYTHKRTHAHIYNAVKSNEENLCFSMGCLKNIFAISKWNGKWVCIPFWSLWKTNNNRFSHKYTYKHMEFIFICKCMVVLDRSFFCWISNSWNICMNNIQLIKTPPSSFQFRNIICLSGWLNFSWIRIAICINSQ